MYAYAALLYLRYRGGRARRQTQEALSPPPSGIVGVAILTDSNATWRPGDFHWGWGDFGIHYRYRVLKLADWRAQGTELADDPRLFAWVIRTWLAVRGAGRALDAQATVRRSIGRAAVAARRQGTLTAPQAIAIYTFLDALNTLPDDLAEAIDREVQLIEEATMQEVLNRYERRALERGLATGHAAGHAAGREEGVAYGMATVVLKLLAAKGIALADATTTRIHALDRDTLLGLTEASLGLDTPADVDRWLMQHASAE